MPFFKISRAKGSQVLGTVEADDVLGALDVFASRSEFWDFEDLARSMDTSVEQARGGLIVREIAAPADVEEVLRHDHEMAVL